MVPLLLVGLLKFLKPFGGSWHLLGASWTCDSLQGRWCGGPWPEGPLPSPTRGALCRVCGCDTLGRPLALGSAAALARDRGCGGPWPLAGPVALARGAWLRGPLAALGWGPLKGPWPGGPRGPWPGDPLAWERPKICILVQESSYQGQGAPGGGGPQTLNPKP